MSEALHQVLESAFKSHQSGQFDEAERQYRDILSGDPLHPDALHLLGLLHHQRGRSGEAEALITKAAMLRPEAVFFENLAAIQKSQGALGSAIETCRAGLARASSPRLTSTLLEVLLDAGRHGEALALLEEGEPAADRLADRAFCLARLGRMEEAAAVAERSLAIDDTNANALSVLAEVAAHGGRHAQAVELWSRVLSVRPDWVAARINLGLSYLNVGAVAAALDTLLSIAVPEDAGLATQLLNGRSAAYRASEKAELARRSLEAAAALAPGSADLLSNLSELQRRDDVACAQRLAERAVAIDPGNAGAHSNNGLSLEEMNRLEEAVASFRRAIALQPGNAEFLNNAGGALRWLGRFEEARIVYRRFLAMDSASALGWYGLGAIQLLMGELAQGWINYGWRVHQGKVVKQRPFRVPLSQGPIQTDGTLLVWGEQGLGDEIVHGSMLPDLVRMRIRAVVECDARMVSLFSRAMPTLEFVARSNPPAPRLMASDIATQIPMGNLAQWCRTRIDDFPGSGYLVPRADLVDHWRRRLAELGDGPKIGFAWRSLRTDGVARRCHPPILEWAPVLTQPRATFVSLQYGESEHDLRAIESKFGVRVHVFPDLDLFNDLEGIAALSAALDMMISTGTTAFCLPAAIGLPVWLVLAEGDLGRFGTDRYPWFSNVSAYAHRLESPWSSTIDAIARNLAAALS